MSATGTPSIGTPSALPPSTSTSSTTSSVSPQSGERGTGTSARFAWVLLLVPVVLLVVLGWTHRWVEEDAFLNFRVVDQIRAGHGPVFNVGERVEVATSTLWLGVLVVVRTVLPFVKLEWSSMLIGLVLSGLGVWWAQRGAGDLWRRDRSELLVPLGALVFVSLPVSWEWATSGLENGLSIGWLGAVMLVLARTARRAQPVPTRAIVGAGVLVGLGPLVRPDLAVMSACALVALVIAPRLRGRDLAVLLGAALAIPVFSEIFRASYYGVLVPNTALAKDSAGTYWSQGWNYFVDFVAPYWLFVPALVLVVVAVLLLRERIDVSLAAVLALPVGGVLHALYITKSGGDYLHGRLLLPSLFAVVAPFAAVPWRPRLRVPVVVVGVWALLAFSVLRPGQHPGLVPVTDHGVVLGRVLMSELTRPGRDPVLATDFRFDDGPEAKRLQEQGARALVAGPEPLRGVTPERTTLVSLASGISGYRAGPDVLVREVNSLGDPVGSHITPTPLSRPGHRKRLEWAWLLALSTRPGTGPYTIENLGVIPLVADEFEGGRIDPDDIAAARRALRCGALAELVDSTQGSLDAGRAWSNLTGAIGRTRLVVPRDPHEAERAFCG